MARRPVGWNSDRWSSGRLTGNGKSSDSEAFLNSRIPVEHRYTQVILSKHRMRPKY
jgi:hypothetical protein